MRGGSLFSGIGGFELAAHLAGLDVDWRWQVEHDDACRRVLARHFPETNRSVTDVREANATNLEPVDLIVGGFPCQDISVAGNGAGLAGERSGLWSEYARVVRELRPRFVVVENSPALLSRGFDVVAGDLAACGYDLEWDCIPAGAVGAPHRRDRIWIVAHANGDRLRQQPIDERRGGSAGQSPYNGAQRNPDATDADGLGGREGRTRGAVVHGGVRPQREAGETPDAALARLEGWQEGLLADSARGYWRSVAPPEPTLRRVDDGFSSRVDRPARGRRERERLKQIGNAVVPQVAALALARVKELQ